MQQLILGISNAIQWVIEPYCLNPKIYTYLETSGGQYLNVQLYSSYQCSSSLQPSRLASIFILSNYPSRGQKCSSSALALKGCIFKISKCAATQSLSLQLRFFSPVGFPVLKLFNYPTSNCISSAPAPLVSIFMVSYYQLHSLYYCSTSLLSLQASNLSLMIITVVLVPQSQVSNFMLS